MDGEHEFGRRIVRSRVAQTPPLLDLCTDDLVERRRDGRRPFGITAAGRGVVLGHPSEQPVFGAWPTQPVGLSAHRQRASDLGDGVDRGVDCTFGEGEPR